MIGSSGAQFRRGNFYTIQSTVRDFDVIVTVPACLSSQDDWLPSKPEQPFCKLIGPDDSCGISVWKVIADN